MMQPYANYLWAQYQRAWHIHEKEQSELSELRMQKAMRRWYRAFTGVEYEVV